MTFASWTIVVLLAGDVQPQSDASDASCPERDNFCNARRFERLSKSASKPQHRAAWLHGAHVSYVALFDQTGKARHLCAARRTFDQSLAIKGISKQQRVSFESARAELEARERRSGATCPTTAPRQQIIQAPKVAELAASRGGSPEEPTLSTAQEAPRPLPVAPSADGLLLPVPRRSRASSSLPTPETPRVRPPIGAGPTMTGVDGRPADPTPRRLLIAGGLSLGAGIGFAALAGYSGARLAHASRESFELYAENQGRGYAAELAHEDALRRDHARWLPITITTAALSGTSVIVGAVLVAVGKRRVAAVTSRAALLPVPGGLAVHARF